MATKKKSIELSMRHKKEVLDLLDKGVSQRKVAEQFDISKTSVNNIARRKLEILKASEENGDRKRRIRATPNDVINNKVWDFVVTCRAANIKVQGPMIQAKAKEVAQNYNITDFKASNGWLQSFLSRNNLSLRSPFGESAGVDLSPAEEWKAKLSDLLKKYRPEDHFNANETGLLYRQTSKQSYDQKGEYCKERLSVLFCCSATGEKLRPLVIGNTRYPRAFRSASIDVDNLPVEWRFNEKTCMTSTIFNDWLLCLNCLMQREKRQILLLINDASSHKTSLTLSNVDVQFMPDNLTSEVQPLNRGIIRAVKTQYRIMMFQHILVTETESAMSETNLCQTINVLQAIRWINRAWEKVSTETIRKCFKRTGCPGPKILSNEGSEEKALADLINSLPSNLRNNVSSAEEIINIDEHLICHEHLPIPTEEVFQCIVKDETLISDSDSEPENADDKTVAVESETILTHEEATNYIKRLMAYSSVHLPHQVETYLRLQTDMEEASYDRIISNRQ